MTKLWMAICATVIVGGYGLEAMGEGGNHEPAAADNLGHGKAGDFVRLNEIPGVIVMGLLHSSGAVNTHGQQGLTGVSGNDSGGGGDDSDSLGGNATAGGWGGDKP